MDLVGAVLENNAKQQYKVVRVSGKSNGLSGATKYLIRFIETGYEREVEKVEMQRGKIKDKFAPSVFGIGILGDVKMVKYKKEYNVWSGMLERCYDPSCEAYYRYGGVGVKVCDRWITFTNFLEDISYIEGYNEELFKKGFLQLDKDIKQQHIPHCQKQYSLETCTFVPREINHKFRDIENMKFKFKATDPDGNVQIRNGLKEFCREYPELNRTSISQCLKGKKENYKGWKFEFIGGNK